MAETMSSHFDGFTTLVLNADFRPLSYYPLSLWSWQDAIKAIYQDRVQIVSEYDDAIVHSPSTQMKVPSVIALKEYVAPQQKPAFTRFNVFLRDRWCCQYCGQKFRTQELTFDHVIPRSRGGRTTWDNIVTACQDCNALKGNMMPEKARMYPRTKPREPTNYELQERGRGFPPHFLHKSWGDYLYWDTELVDY